MEAHITSPAENFDSGYTLYGSPVDAYGVVSLNERLGGLNFGHQPMVHFEDPAYQIATTPFHGHHMPLNLFTPGDTVPFPNKSRLNSQNWNKKVSNDSGTWEGYHGSLPKKEDNNGLGASWVTANKPDIGESLRFEMSKSQKRKIKKIPSRLCDSWVAINGGNEDGPTFVDKVKDEQPKAEGMRRGQSKKGLGMWNAAPSKLPMPGVCIGDAAPQNLPMPGVCVGGAGILNETSLSRTIRSVEDSPWKDCMQQQQLQMNKPAAAKKDLWKQHGGLLNYRSKSANNVPRDSHRANRANARMARTLLRRKNVGTCPRRGSPAPGGGGGFAKKAAKTGRWSVPGKLEMEQAVSAFDKYKDMSLAEMEAEGVLIEMAKDLRGGSRAVQQKLDAADEATRSAVFDTFCDDALCLTMDVFGNYVIQKYLVFGTDQQEWCLMNALREHIVDLTTHTFGCRVIQKAIVNISDAHLQQVVHALKGRAMSCAMNQNGSHVIQKLIECANPELMTELMDDFEGNILELSFHPFGCRIVQRMLENCDEDGINLILNEVIPDAAGMCMNEYGNYIIQHILKNGIRPHKLALFDAAGLHMPFMCQNKFASNVVESFWNTGIKTIQDSTLDILLNEKAMDMLVQDKYGNYVVQKMMQHGSTEQRMRIFEALNQFYPHLEDLSYGRFINIKMNFLKQEMNISDGGSHRNRRFKKRKEG